MIRVEPDMLPTQILVTGAPGNVGTELVKALKLDHAFRVGAHNVERAKNALGYEIDCVHFDFLNPDSFAPAFSGIQNLFLVRPPALSNVNRDIAPALRAAKAAGVPHIVFLSIVGAESNPFAPHHKIEQLIKELGFRHTFLRCSFFMQNLSTVHAEEIRVDSEIVVPVGRAKTSFVDCRDVAAVAALRLLNPGTADQELTLTGSEALTYFEVASILTKVRDRQIQYKNPSVMRFVAGHLRSGERLPFVLVMATLYTLTRMGLSSRTTNDVAEILGRPPITFEEFALEFADVWRPAGERSGLGPTT